MIFKSKAIWHVQRFQSRKHFDLKHVLQLFSFPSALLFSYFKTSVKQYCLRPLQNQTKAISVDGTAIAQKRTCPSELSVIIWIIQVYNSVLSTFTEHCVWEMLLLTSVFDGGLVISAEITSRPRNHTPPVASSSPLFWAGSTFLGLNTKHILTKKNFSTDTR